MNSIPEDPMTEPTPDRAVGEALYKAVLVAMNGVTPLSHYTEKAQFIAERMMTVLDAWHAKAHEKEDSDSTKRVEIELHHSMVLWNVIWKIILDGKATDKQIEAHEALSLAMRKAKK
jgi:hypothetical protein